MKCLFSIFLILVSVFFCHTAYSNDAKDSAARVLSGISVAYQKGKLPETVYMDSVYKVICTFQSQNIPFTNKELLQLLITFRKVAWSREQDWEHKRLYYAMLSNQAQFERRMGEMLYYAEKIEELEQEAYHRPSLTALSIIDGYYEARRAPQNIANLYKKNKGYLSSFPAMAKKKIAPVNDLVQAVIVLEKSARALYELNDIAAGKEAETLIAQIDTIAREVYKANDNVIANIVDRQRITLYQRSIAENNAGLMDSVFRSAEASLASPETPDYLKNAIYGSLVGWKTKYYLVHYNADSIAQYLKIFNEMMGNNPSPYDKYLFNKYRARDLYNKGRYKESADLLGTSVEFLDSSQSMIGKDMDDLLYANAKAEENHILLQEAKASRFKTEKALLLTGGIIALLLIGGVFIIRYIRRTQRTKLLEFKLNMARNIHDETNPALLYAKALIKASRSDKDNERLNAELGSHMDHTMELIRSLSHDLKSDKQYVLHDLVAKTEQTLEKLNTGSDFTFNIHKSIDKKHFISHYQFSQLTSILNECITNSIKHATFNKINITFANRGNKLMITYNDNGKGWGAKLSDSGIGIKNMEERIRQINGDLKIDNDYPDGYQINISSLLR